MTDDIKAIRGALQAGPTPGPWIDDRHASWVHPITTVNAPDRKPRRDVVAYVRLSAVVDVSCTIGKAEQEWKNAAYIAACHPERIARLLDAHDRLQAACSAAHAMLLRGEDDREILAVLEVWKGNA